MERILMTGGSGFIGHHFHEEFHERSIINYDIQPPFEEKESEFVQGSILEKDKLNEALKEVDIVLHLAATHFDFQENYFKTNVDGTANLLEKMSENNIKKLVFYSSVAVYGELNDGITEEVIPVPNIPYGESKFQAEKLVEQWCEKDSERSALIIRPAVVYGPYNFGNVFNLIKQIDSGFFLNIGDGQNVKSIVYVKNLVNYTLELMKEMLPGVKIYNGVDRPNYGIFDLTSIIANKLNKKVPYRLPLFIAKTLALPFDLLSAVTGKDVIITRKRIDKFCSSTHFIPENLKKEGIKQDVSTEKGIEETINWYKSVNWKQLYAEWQERVKKYN
ncbi:MAG: NAD(P)-dependent oxidoreductase [Balneolaceae bacterium]|nr:NAD(P)-dependent oxidoreductase [Balneolaceae bacterium]